MLDDFFVNSKNVWYLGEYISGVCQVNQEKIINKIIDTNDKIYISKIMKDDFILSNLEEKYKDILQG